MRGEDKTNSTQRTDRFQRNHVREDLQATPKQINPAKTNKSKIPIHSGWQPECRIPEPPSFWRCHPVQPVTPFFPDPIWATNSRPPCWDLLVSVTLPGFPHLTLRPRLRRGPPAWTMSYKPGPRRLPSNSHEKAPQQPSLEKLREFKA